MGNREELLELFKKNRQIAELNPKIAAEVLSGKTPQSLIPARLPRLDSSQSESLVESSCPAEPQARANGGAKKRKYGNTPVDIDGIHYDSQKEANRHHELLTLERAGAITNLVLKPKYVFEHNGVRIASYTPDFSYEEDGHLVVEDTKGFRTREFIIKKSLMLAFFGIVVLET